MDVQKNSYEIFGKLCWFFRGKHHSDSRWLWVVCISSAICGTLNTGFVLSFGVLFPELMEHIDETTETTGEYITLHVISILIALKYDHQRCCVTFEIYLYTVDSR